VPSSTAPTVAAKIVTAQARQRNAPGGPLVGADS
jgi:hypothetical protein